eukprot:1223803-Amorphochlora_amoeboformis.AAC.2
MRLKSLPTPRRPILRRVEGDAAEGHELRSRKRAPRPQKGVTAGEDDGKSAESSQDGRSHLVVKPFECVTLYCHE